MRTRKWEAVVLETEELSGATLSQNSTVVPLKHGLAGSLLPGGEDGVDVQERADPAAVPPSLVTSAPGFQARTAWGVSQLPLPCSPSAPPSALTPQVPGETSAMTCWWLLTPSPTPCRPW